VWGVGERCSKNNFSSEFWLVHVCSQSQTRAHHPTLDEDRHTSGEGEETARNDCMGGTSQAPLSAASRVRTYRTELVVVKLGERHQARLLVGRMQQCEYLGGVYYHPLRAAAPTARQRNSPGRLLLKTEVVRAPTHRRLAKGCIAVISWAKEEPIPQFSASLELSVETSRLRALPLHRRVCRRAARSCTLGKQYYIRSREDGCAGEGGTERRGGCVAVGWCAHCCWPLRRLETNFCVARTNRAPKISAG